MEKQEKNDSEFIRTLVTGRITALVEELMGLTGMSRREVINYAIVYYLENLKEILLMREEKPHKWEGDCDDWIKLFIIDDNSEDPSIDPTKMEWK